MIKEILIKILLRLIDYDYENIRDDQIADWLASQYQSQGFRGYFKRRDLSILKTMGTGLQEKKYWIWIGRRLELMKLLEQVESARNKGRDKAKSKKGQ